jgi:hypothetical protein
MSFTPYGLNLGSAWADASFRAFFEKGCDVLISLSLILASMTAQPGLGVGAGYLDRSFGVELRAELGLMDKGWNLRLALPLRGIYSPSQGLRLRASDWDEIGDFSALLEALDVGDEAFRLRGGRLLLGAGHGSIVDGYRAGGHPDHQAAGLSALWRGARLAGQVAVDRISDPGLLFGHLRAALRRVDASSPWIPSAGLTLAVDPKPAQPQEAGIDGRLGLDIETLWRLRDHRVGLYVDGVMGLGPTWAYRSRLHIGILARWYERNWRVHLRLEGRRSGDGLPAGPYDNLYALFRHEQGFVRPAANAEPGFGLEMTLQNASKNGLTLRLAKDPFGEASMKRFEARLNWQWPDRGALYLAGGTWETGRQPPSWYAQAEARYALLKGLAGWLRLRRMRRQLLGEEREVVDVMIGLSGAVSLRASQ